MWIIDVDGTTAVRKESPGERHWSDWHRVGEDLPNQAVITIIRALALAGQQLVWLSGRPEQCRKETGTWLHKHVCATGWRPGRDIALCDAPLFLAPDGDNRGDAVIKSEIYVKQIVPVYGEAEGALDDRPRVARMWRHWHGLTVLSCADGDF